MTERTEQTTKKSLLEEKWLCGRCKVSMREYTKPPSKRLRVGEYLITAAWREKTHLVSMSFCGPRGTLVQIEETVQWHEVRRQTSWQKLLVWHWKGVISQPVYRRYGHRIYPHSPRHYGISACLTICHTHTQRRRVQNQRWKLFAGLRIYTRQRCVQERSVMSGQRRLEAERTLGFTHLF